jgi:hypothetical protein
MCPILKKLFNTLQPYNEVVQVVEETLASKKGCDIRVLEHLLQYGDYQFGIPISGINYRERTDGQRIANWDVDMGILNRISDKIIDTYASDPSLSIIIRQKGMFPHLERSLNILTPWMVTIDTDATNQSNSLSFEQMDCLMKASYQSELQMATVAMSRNQLDVSEGHCHRCLVNSKRIGVEGEEKTHSILQALRTYVSLRQCQGDYSGAVLFAEEAYNLVVDAYDPVHPQVQVC